MADWYHENMFRAFPLVNTPASFTYTPAVGSPTTVRLPNSTLVDFESTLGPQVLTIASGAVRLDSVTRAGSTFTFTVRSDFGGLQQYKLTFVRDLSDPIGTTQFVVATNLDGSTIADNGCTGLQVWQGWLVTGPLADLAAIVADGGTLTQSGSEAQFEPTCHRMTAGYFIHSVNVANETRTRATQPGLAAPPPGYLYITQATCLQGEVRLVPGYNAALRMDTFDNSLTIDAGLGAGLGQPCGEIKTYPDEALPTDSNLYSGGPSCKEIIKTINGQTGPLLRLIAGTGVTIMPDPHDVYGIIVNGDMNDLASCPGTS